MKLSKILVVSTVIVVAASFFYFDLQQYLNLASLKEQQSAAQEFVSNSPLAAVSVFFVTYVVATALSFPGAALLTLFAGALFGLAWGTLIVSFASTIGATCSFLISRYLLRDSVQRRFSQQLKPFNEGIEKDGGFYLFTLRLVPIMPFFMINTLMGLTTIKARTFYLMSQIGMLAGTIVYVNAGTQLSKLDSLSGILSPSIIFSFCLLGIFPLIAKKLLSSIKNNRELRKFDKPKSFDTNLIVIGGGSAGLVSGLIAGAVKSKVTLIEKHKMGGDCLNTGCIPSKALIRSAKVASTIKKSSEFGIKSLESSVNFANVMERIQHVIRKIEPHDSVERFTSLGVDCIEGDATILSPYVVQVNGKKITTRNIIIATGARPFVPPIDGLDQVSYLTSDNLWNLRQQPKRLVVLGGGPIGCELSQAFARLGSNVIQIEQAPRLMVREDSKVSAFVEQRLAEDGVTVRTQHQATKVEVRNGQKTLLCRNGEKWINIEFDEILVAVGRVANTSGFGLDNIGIELTQRKTIAVNDNLQTSIPNVYACGDVAGPYQFTHTASHQAWYATVNSLFGHIKKFKVDYRVIPWATFVDPEVARVGINEQEAIEQGIDYQLTEYGLDDLDRAITDSEDQGFVRVITQGKTDKILGVTIVGHSAAELLTEFVQAMKHGLGLNKILGTIHIYPTYSEANKFAAGNWKRANAPENILTWVEKYHRWRRKESAYTTAITPQRGDT
ncbi:pyridine nucleotide-disulfide oxidoreductase [Gammaproteobacteria bacterium 45_16_T64]|nr:pyridine nucleotide-disulfide oxidoreductase [Gammaproteobacteria bacterium 45_16_T64]